MGARGVNLRPTTEIRRDMYSRYYDVGDRKERGRLETGDVRRVGNIDRKSPKCEKNS